jgi:hypothetical protein
MMTNTYPKLATVICCRCKEAFEYEEDGSMNCLPDGAFLHYHPKKWVCVDCLEDGE